MTDDEELFEHQVTPWTAGQLRHALEGVPDDMPVIAVTAEEPGSDIAGDDQVIISAGPWARVDVGPSGSWTGGICMPGATSEDIRAKIESGELQPDHFAIDLELPPGQYYRRRP